MDYILHHLTVDNCFGALVVLFIFLWMTEDFWAAIISRIKYGVRTPPPPPPPDPHTLLLARAHDLADAAEEFLDTYDSSSFVDQIPPYANAQPLKASVEVLRATVDRYNNETAED